MNGFSTEEDSHDGPPAPPFFGQSCCLIEDGERCGRSAGNASFSKRIQKSISQKKLKLDIDKSVRHLYICDFHKNFIQSVRNKRKRKTSDDGGESPDHDVEVPEVDLFQLQVNTLRRYKRHYKIPTRPGLNKAQLAECWAIFNIIRSFYRQPVDRRYTIVSRGGAITHLSMTSWLCGQKQKLMCLENAHV
ncbi:Histone deacetylase complex subunit SAP30L [Triplophysa rosa]|uniref:Histone deacetylase complex subunit SAP30L n=1 Tax=Triplophysa rosa TaxID=992332 RepID=A0A9W7T564_TRIRA|nr:Histone deacetylase complex subunit SAP30L [Triplophysa rosa]